MLNVTNFDRDELTRNSKFNMLIPEAGRGTNSLSEWLTKTWSELRTLIHEVETQVEKWILRLKDIEILEWTT